VDKGQKSLSRFGPQECGIPYVMRLVVVLLGNRIRLVLEGGPCHPYIGSGGGYGYRSRGIYPSWFYKIFPQLQVISFLTN
jgi:hypothetical protein